MLRNDVTPPCDRSVQPSSAFVMQDFLVGVDAFNKYKSATGAVLDNNTGLLKVTNAQLSALQSLFFIIGGVSHCLFSFGCSSNLPARIDNL